METAIGSLCDEEKIIARSKADPCAFAPLFDHYYPRIYRYALYRVQDAEVVDDIAAHVFEKALANIHQYQPSRGSFAAWIFGIARNAVRKHFRAQRFHRLISLDATGYQPPAGLHPVGEIAERNDTLACLMPLLSKLGDRERDLIALKFGGGLTNRRIAQLTGLSESNVGVILYRTLRLLRDQLREEESP
jgi:RNA polymerase sigma-70 factor (ECF subfamily)